MKKIYILFLFVLSITLATGCNHVNSKTEDLNAIREAAWNSITDQDKKQNALELKNAKASNIDFDEMMNEYSIPKGAELKKIDQLYKVTFDTNHVIFIEGNTKKIVGTITKK